MTMGRPRNFPSASTGLNTPNSPEGSSRNAPSSRDSPATVEAHPGSVLLGRPGGKSQSGGPNPGSVNTEELLYACEDCGLRFKDAPSRNRHQSIVHYGTSEGREEDVQEDRQRTELSTSERVQDDGGVGKVN